jgi:hypothetical protein
MPIQIFGKYGELRGDVSKGTRPFRFFRPELVPMAIRFLHRKRPSAPHFKPV